MNKMPMCRICLVENVRMYIVNDKDLQQLYEKLTDVPFVTEDRRPVLACFLCFSKLKQCCQLQRQCLEAEELFAQMMNEPNLSVNRGQLKCPSGLIVTPVANISIVDVSHVESIAVREELPAVCERLAVIQPKVEHLEFELELEPLNNSCSDAEDIPAQQTKPRSEGDVPLIKIKTEVEEEREVSSKKRRASDTTRPAVAKKRNLHIRGKKLEDVITEIQKKNEKSDTKVTQNTQSGEPLSVLSLAEATLIPKFQEPLTNTTPQISSSSGNDIKKCNVTKHIRSQTCEKPFKCEECPRSFTLKVYLTKHLRTHTGENPYKCDECQLSFSQKVHYTSHIRAHAGEKPYKCKECQRCFSQKISLKRHILTHTGEKPFKCQKCQVCFSLKTTLLSHIRTHTGEKPYKCDECQLCFSQRTTLLRHVRTHTGEKPYKCEKCERCFRCKQQLTRHIVRHTDEKPIKC